VPGLGQDVVLSAVKALMQQGWRALTRRENGLVVVPAECALIAA